MKNDNSDIIATLIGSAAALGSAWIGRPPKPPQPVNIYVEPPQQVYIYVINWFNQIS